MIRVRPSLPQDVHDVIFVAGELHKEAGLEHNSEYVPQDAYDHFMFCLESPNKLILTLEDEQGICGFFIAGKSQSVWNFKCWNTSEELFYILKDRRKGAARATLRCFERWEAWARDHAITGRMIFCPTIIMQENQNRWDSFCKVTGFERLGVNYGKDLMKC